MRTIVVAGSYVQFQSYCWGAGLNPRDSQRVLYADRRSLQGLRGPFEVVYFGTYYDRSDLTEIRAILNSRGTPTLRADEGIPPRGWAVAMIFFHIRYHVPCVSCRVFDSRPVYKYRVRTDLKMP